MMLPPPSCKVYTPRQLAEAMVHALEPGPLDLWLDPCMGPGAFIAPLRENGVCKERIVGIDIEPLSGIQEQGATTIRGVDFFTWCASTERRFTKIIANPPLSERLFPYV
jgi:type I restriction-modification system DNA methylase subunit